MPGSSGAPADRRFECASTFESLEEIIEAAQSYAARVFGNDDLAHRFVLALSEAVTNAIEHGNASDPEKRVVVEFRVRAGRVEVLVTDQGMGFDPASVKPPLDEPNLTRTHGRGLHIIRQVADEVHYEAGGRRVRMVFRRAG